jgi:hypothetical protein
VYLGELLICPERLSTYQDFGRSRECNGLRAVGSLHSSDETSESWWSEGRDISNVSFDETFWILEVL